MKMRGSFSFHIVNHAIPVFFKVSLVGFVDAPVMCIPLSYYSKNSLNHFMKSECSFRTAIHNSKLQTTYWLTWNSKPLKDEKKEGQIAAIDFMRLSSNNSQDWVALMSQPYIVKVD